MVIEIMGRGPHRKDPTPYVDRRMWISRAVTTWKVLDPRVDEVWNIHKPELFEQWLRHYRGAVHLDARYAPEDAYRWLCSNYLTHSYDNYWFTKDFGIASTASLILAYIHYTYLNVGLKEYTVILNGVDLLGGRERIQRTNLLLYVGAYYQDGMRVEYVDGRKLYQMGDYVE